MNRRMFLKSAGLIVGFCLLPFENASAKSYAIPLSKVAKLKEVGEYMVIRIKGRNILLIRDTADTIQAYDPTCPHKGCTVAYSKQKNLIICPCHQSTFDLSGALLKGPSPKSLQRFDASLSGENIIVSLN